MGWQDHKIAVSAAMNIFFLSNTSTIAGVESSFKIVMNKAMVVIIWIIKFVR